MLRESIKKETLQTMMIFSLITVVAESETNAINEAKKRHPGLQVCYIEQKKSIIINKATESKKFGSLVFI